MVLRFLALAIMIATLACSAYDQGCACGGRWTDLGGQQSKTASVPHSRGDHCACRCGGAGEEVLFPPFQRDCPAFEVACQTPEGQAARYVCR